MLNFSQNRERVTYVEYRKFIFDRSKSIGPMSDRYMVINIPAVVSIYLCSLIGQYDV